MSDNNNTLEHELSRLSQQVEKLIGLLETVVKIESRLDHHAFRLNQHEERLNKHGDRFDNLARTTAGNDVHVKFNTKWTGYLMMILISSAVGLLFRFVGA